MAENAPDAIVVSRRRHRPFPFRQRTRLPALSMCRWKSWTELTPADVSPEFQADGRRSGELARELMAEALGRRAGRCSNGFTRQLRTVALISTEVRLLRLPRRRPNPDSREHHGTTRNANIAERAILANRKRSSARCSKQSSHGVVLHDENELLEVNPAAARIMGRQHAARIDPQEPARTRRRNFSRAAKLPMN